VLFLLMHLRPFLFLTYPSALVMTLVTYLWTHSVERNDDRRPHQPLGCAYSWMAIYPVELFPVRCALPIGIRVQRHPFDGVDVPHRRGNHHPTLQRSRALRSL
jgi:hypothetical protein